MQEHRQNIGFIGRNEPSLINHCMWCTSLSTAIDKLSVNKCTVKTNNKIDKQPDDFDI